MPQPFSENFTATALIELAGKCHTLSIGDSQSTPVLDYLWYDAWPRVCPQFYHYFCVSGANASQSLTNNLGYVVGNASTVDAGIINTENGYKHKITITSNSNLASTVVTTAANHGYVAGDTVTIAGQTGTVSINGTHTIMSVGSATTFTIAVDCTAGGGTGGTATIDVSGYSLGPTRMHRYVADIAVDTAINANSIMMPRQIAATPTHNNTNRTAPWPTLPANSSQPWYHGGYIKGKLLVWKDETTFDKFAVYIHRAGASANNNNGTSRTQFDASAATVGPVASDWTAPHQDTGTYDVTTNGIANDHEVALRLYSSSAVYAESGTTLIPLGAIFARCNSSGDIPWNSDNSGCGYAAIGRSGACVSNWLNYATQAHWQAYFTATVLVPNQVTKIRIMLGHNVDNTGIDVGDGDGSQVEQTGGETNAYFKKRYKAFIERLRAAYMAAFPSGRVLFELIIPWRSLQSSFFLLDAGASSANRVIKEVAAETGASWFSFYDYWNGVSPFANLHAWTPANGQMLAMALRDGMDRATRFKYTSLGPIQYSRQFRDTVRV